MTLTRWLIDLDIKVRVQVWYENMNVSHPTSYLLTIQTIGANTLFLQLFAFDLYLTLIWRPQVKSDKKFEFIPIFLSDDNTMVQPNFKYLMSYFTFCKKLTLNDCEKVHHGNNF